MFETESFRKQIQETVNLEAFRNGMREYETGIVSMLHGLASENEAELMERELRKAVFERRGIPDALRSVELLTRDASRYAAADNRTTVQLADMRKAYELNFCRIWPFCK